MYYGLFIRRLVYDRGYRCDTFATADEMKWSGYDRAWRAGARAALRAEGRVNAYHYVYGHRPYKNDNLNILL